MQKKRQRERETFDLGVGLSPAIDKTIQFSELPLVISVEGWQSTSSEWPLEPPASPSPSPWQIVSFNEDGHSTLIDEITKIDLEPNNKTHKCYLHWSFRSVWGV